MFFKNGVNIMKNKIMLLLLLMYGINVLNLSAASINILNLGAASIEARLSYLRDAQGRQLLRATGCQLAIVQEIQCMICLDEKTEDKCSLLPTFQCKDTNKKPFRHFVCRDCLPGLNSTEKCPMCRAPRIDGFVVPQDTWNPEHRARLLATGNGVAANLRWVDLEDVDLRNSSLMGADLTDAYLMRVNLSSASLIGANLSDASLFYAKLIGTNLTGANLADVFLINTDLTDVVLTGADLTNAYFIHVHGLSLENKIYAESHGAIVSDWDPRSLSYLLEENDGEGAILYNAPLHGIDLSNANLTNAILKGAHLNGTNLTRADLTRADLTGADVTDVNFESAVLTGARFIHVIGLSSADREYVISRGAIVID